MHRLKRLQEPRDPLPATPPLAQRPGTSNSAAKTTQGWPTCGVGGCPLLFPEIARSFLLPETLASLIVMLKKCSMVRKTL